MKKVFLSFIFLASTLTATDVHAHDYWASHFGVGCIACHTSNSGGPVRNAARAAYRSGGLNGLAEFIKTSGANTRPRINEVLSEWDAEAGVPMTIPLAVSDDQHDSFYIFPKPVVVGAKFSEQYLNDGNLPTVNFEWTPTDAQADKVYHLSFYAKETDSVNKLRSLPLKVKIRVWPAGNRDQSSVEKLIVSTSKWQDGKLILKGKLVLNKVMTPAEKLDYLKRTDLTVDLNQGSDGSGAAIVSAMPIKFDPKGNWILSDVSLPATPSFSCNLTMTFEGAKASRKINGAPKDCIPAQ